MIKPIESALLFVPGRSSFVTQQPGEGFKLNLSASSTKRAEVAQSDFNPAFHTQALFAGGYPGVAQDWPAEHTPPDDEREAILMAQPLQEKLRNMGWQESEIAGRVLTQGDSDNSIGDVLHSIDQGLIDPYDFDESHGIDLVAGMLHAARFRDILSVALNIDPRLIRRVRTVDNYSIPETQFQPGESALKGMAKEIVATQVTRRLLQSVRPGKIEDLRHAEQRFIAIAKGGALSCAKALVAA